MACVAEYGGGTYKPTKVFGKEREDEKIGFVCVVGGYVE